MDDEHIEQLIAEHKRRLNLLQIRKAREGRNTPPEVDNEITDIRQMIGELRAQLTGVDGLGEETEFTVDSVPFEDRQIHKRNITTEEHTASYFLLDAPAGYGKTELLKEIKRVASDKGWVCGYICADEHTVVTSQKLIASLAQVLGLKGGLAGATTEQLAANLGARLRQQRRNDITRKGVILLIDLGRASRGSLAVELARDFIPKVHDSLRVDNFFQHTPNRFRVVLAGRHLATYVTQHQSEYSVQFRVEQLPPLTYQDLWNATQAYLSPDTHIDTVTEVAARVMHVSGGHPGCIGSLLQLYKAENEPAAGDFFRNCASEINEVIERETGEVLHGISPTLHPVLDILGIFRKVNFDILDTLLRGGHVVGYADNMKLADELTTGYLLSHVGVLLCNENHHLLGIRQRGNPEIARVAQDSCWRYLQGDRIRKPEAWALEYLYQFLQSHALEVDQPANRRRLRKELITTELPKVLRLLTQDQTPARFMETRYEIDLLLANDHEFQFVLNYFTRETIYDERPLEAFRQALDRFFVAAQAPGGHHA